MFYNGAYSSYNAFTGASPQDLPSHGFQFQATYTWAKDMTDADDVWSAPGRAEELTLNIPAMLEVRVCSRQLQRQPAVCRQL